MRVQERGHSEYFISPAYRLAEENQNVPLIPPLNLNLPYQRTELEGRANLFSTARAKASVALGSESGTGGPVSAISDVIALLNCSCSCGDLTCFQPLRSMQRFIYSK